MPGFLSKILVKIHAKLQRFSNMASDWLAIILPGNEMPGLKILLTNMDFNSDISYQSKPMVLIMWYISQTTFSLWYHLFCRPKPFSIQQSAQYYTFLTALYCAKFRKVVATEKWIIDKQVYSISYHVTGIRLDVVVLVWALLTCCFTQMALIWGVTS